MADLETLFAHRIGAGHEKEGDERCRKKVKGRLASWALTPSVGLQNSRRRCLASQVGNYAPSADNSSDGDSLEDIFEESDVLL